MMPWTAADSRELDMQITKVSWFRPPLRRDPRLAELLAEDRRGMKCMWCARRIYPSGEPRPEPDAVVGSGNSCRTCDRRRQHGTTAPFTPRVVEQARKQRRVDAVADLTRKGMSASQIATQLGISCRHVVRLRAIARERTAA